MEHLYEKLSDYGKSGIYPCHMPGHKRQGWGRLPGEWYSVDITEIEGFDNLHHPEGILRELQREAARLYGAEESFYLVNGSTCGILAAVSCAVSFGGHILMARNCHKSAYHAVYLRQLKPRYLYPDYLEEYGILEAVTPEQVRRGLEQEPKAEAVLVVSPTYEGRMADISGIARIVHERGIPLIVDEAHGAHLGLGKGFPENSCQAGADLVIHSVHKTLPALTQTALLHVNGKLADRHRLRKFLQIYQTSSPSYPLMASIDNALEYVDLYGKDAFARFKGLYGQMMGRLSGCRQLKFLPKDNGKQDIGKLLVSVKQTEINGKQLYDRLLLEYHIQTEMAGGDYVLAMFTINDKKETYEHMTEALLDIDRRLASGDLAAEGETGTKGDGIFPFWFSTGKGGIPLAEAWEGEAEDVTLGESVGRYAAEFVSLYPPGAPLLVPGEQITGEFCRGIRESLEKGLTVQGIVQKGDGLTPGEKILIRVIKDKKRLRKLPQDGKNIRANNNIKEKEAE